MQFAQPQNLWWLLLLAPMLGAFVGYWWWKERLKARIGERELVDAMAAQQSSRKQIARGILVLMATALFVLAAAQPQWGQTNRPIKRTGVDVVFALDLSHSMLAEDAAPNRLEAAKNEIETTLELLAGDRIGLVVFTAVSFVQSPLTTDYGAVRFYLDRLRPGQMPMGGTSVGRALQDSVELLVGHPISGEEDEERKTTADMKRAKNQIVVLITDGEDHESDPLGAAAKAAQYNVKIVTVGFGSTSGERIPVHDENGNLVGYKRNRKGEIVTSRLDASTLQKIAGETGGRYIEYDGENTVTNALVDYINKLEKSEMETLLKERYQERYMYFLAPGAVLLLIVLLLGDRRKKSRDEKRRVHDRLVTLIMAFMLVFGAGCEHPFEDTVSEVDEANRLLEDGEHQKALELYQRAQTHHPSQPGLFYDIGRAHLGLQEWDKAREAFARALETDDPSLRFDIHYNLGLALSGKEAWREAYESFKSALKLAETSKAIDDERTRLARHNLEVAFYKLYPPCEKLEDDLEENDSPESAAKLEEGKGSELSLCGADDDWYVVPAMPGTKVSVEATFRVLRDEPDPERPFLPKPQDLQIALFDSSGENILVVDQGLDDPDDAAADGEVSRSISKTLVTEEMIDADAPGILLKVKAADGLEFEYDLEVSSIPPCRALQEEQETNDTPDQAAPIEPAEGLQMHTCPGDQDWFRLTTEIGDTVFVDVAGRPDPETEEPPSLELQIVDAETGETVAEGTREGAFVTAGVREMTEARDLLVHVEGSDADQQGPYLLSIYQYAPCIVGDDRFEENDESTSAAQLDPKIPVHRYLRYCDADPDFFSIPFAPDAKEKKIELGLALVSTPRNPTEPMDRPELTLDLVSSSGDQILAAGKAVERQPDSEAPLPLARVLQANELDGDAATVRVSGEQGFYHLVQLDPQSQENQKSQEKDGQKDDQNQEESEEQEKEGEKGEDGEKNEPKEDQEGREENQEDQQSEEEKASGKNEKEEPEATQAGEEGERKEEEKKEGKKAKAQKPGKEDPQMQRIDDILRALEETDDNFQMRKALEDLPGRYIEKDW